MDLSVITFKDDTRYAYAVGRVRALEKKLLTKADFSRLLDAADFPQALRLLAEMGYPVSEETADYESVLMAEQREALFLLEKLSEGEELSMLFRRRYDYHNLKALLKGKHSQQELEQAFISQATGEGMIGLKGHRSVGGIRSSIYNAVSAEAVKSLTDFMKEFERTNG